MFEIFMDIHKSFFFFGQETRSVANTAILAHDHRVRSLRVINPRPTGTPDFSTTYRGGGGGANTSVYLGSY